MTSSGPIVTLPHGTGASASTGTGAGPRIWVAPSPKKIMVVGVADMIACNDPLAELVTHSLGSCLGIAIYDPLKKVGGLLHLMLPDSSIDPAKGIASPFMFVDTGVPRLFQAVCGLGAEQSRLLVKIAGGAEFLDQNQIFNIGSRNAQALAALLKQNAITPAVVDVGGQISRTLHFEMADGRLTVHVPGHKPYPL